MSHRIPFEFIAKIGVNVKHVKLNIMSDSFKSSIQNNQCASTLNMRASLHSISRVTDLVYRLLPSTIVFSSF